MLLALACVDGVVIFDEETPHAIISTIQPDVLVKGADWGPDNIVGRDVVEARGGRVVRMALSPGFSTHSSSEQSRTRPHADCDGCRRFLAVCGPRRAGHSTRRRVRVGQWKTLCAHAGICAGVGLSACTAMATAASLTLRALLSQAAARASLDRLAPVTAGLTPAAKALAAVAAARQRGPDVARRADRQGRRATHCDARFFYAALEGASEAEVERAVLPLPSLQVDPYRGMTPHFRVAAARGARAARAPRRGTARLDRRFRGGAAAARQPAGTAARGVDRDPSGTEIEPQALADLLVDAGFTRRIRSTSTARSRFAAASSTCFPRPTAEPVRIEFVGDMVETLRRFDPATQRSTGATDQLVDRPRAGAVRRRRAN